MTKGCYYYLNLNETRENKMLITEFDAKFTLVMIGCDQVVRGWSHQTGFWYDLGAH